MIKLIMVHLDGTESDAVRLTAVEELVALFGAHVVALLLNPIPKIVPSDAGAGVQLWTQLTDMAHEAGDRIEAILAHRLAKLSTTSEIRRFDVFAEEAANVAAREARTADLFVALRLGGADVSPMTDDIVEGVLFGSGRHLLLVSKAEHFAEGFEHCLLAWDGGQEAARAMAEALPYLRESRTVSVVVVVDREAELQPEELSGIAAVNYLTQHGIPAAKLHIVDKTDRGISKALIDELAKRKADLMVMGAYGHSRLRERILGGVTEELLHTSPAPLVVAH